MRLFLLMLMTSGTAVFAQVGIGTTTPNAQLDIRSGNQVSPANTDGLLIPKIDAFPATNPTSAQQGMLVYLTTASGSNVPGFYYWDNPSTSWIGVGTKKGWEVSGNTGTTPASNFVGTTDNQPLAFRTNNIERFRVDNVGNVGIGTALPSSKLHIFNHASGMTQNPASIATMEDNAPMYLSLLSSDESGILFGANGNSTNGAIVYNSPYLPDGMLFRTNGNQNRILISSAGNIAFGNFLPDYPLHFESTLGDKICLWGALGNHYGFGIQGNLLQIHADNAASDVAFGWGSSASFTETMRIRGNGRLGVGTSAPAAKVQINASSQSAPANTDGIIIPKVDAFPATNPTALQQGMMVYLTTTIGTKAPGFYYWNNASASWLGVGTTSNWGLFGNAGTTQANNFIGTTDNQSMAIRTNNTERMVFGNTGNIAIGSFTPSFPMEFPMTLGQKLVLYNSNGTNLYGFGIQNSLLQIHSSFSGSDIAFGWGSSAAFNETVRFRGNGSVGIGISNPLAKLHVYNGASGMMPISGTGLAIESSTSNYLDIFSPADNGVLFGSAGGSGSGGVIYNTGIYTNGMIFRTNNATQMTLSSAGNLAVGSVVADARLQVNASSVTNPAITDGILVPRVANFPLTNPTIAQNGMMIFLTTAIGSNPAGFYYWDNASVSWIGVGAKQNWSITGNSGTNPSNNYVGTVDNADLTFRTNGTERARITAAGDVGINTTAPTADLEVNGYTKLGSGASVPAVKMVKLTGTTAATQGVQTNIPHGLTSSKILGVTVLVEYSPGSSVPPSYNGSAGYEYDYYITSTNISIWPKSGNSGSILSKPIRVLVTYEQ